MIHSNKCVFHSELGVGRKKTIVNLILVEFNTWELAHFE